MVGVDQLLVEARSSSTYHTGFQYEPVASIATSVTPSAANQSAIASSPEVKDGNVRVSLRRPPPPGPGVRTQATTSSLPMSIPAHRSDSRSTSLLLVVDVGGARRGQPINDAVKRAKATIRGAGKTPGVNLINGLLRTKENELSQAPPDSHPSRRPQAMGVLSEMDG